MHHLPAKKPLIAMILVMTTAAALAGAQYNSGYEMSGGGYGGGHEGGYGGDGSGGGDQRPKIHLGLRVKIPAFKFELPRLSLPKVTISAKIRQPNRPRTITLPEINLDTTSKVEPPNKGGGGGGGGGGNGNGYGNYGSGGGVGYHTSGSSYGGDSSYGGGSGYGSGGGYGDGEKTNTFTFSTSGDDHPSSSYGGNKYKQQQPKQYRQQSYASSSNVHPAYQVINPEDGGEHMSGNSNSNPSGQEYQYYSTNETKQSQQSTPQTQVAGTKEPHYSPQVSAGSNPDAGFNAPAYVDTPTSASNTHSVGQGDQVGGLAYDLIDNGERKAPVKTMMVSQQPTMQQQHHQQSYQHRQVPPMRSPSLSLHHHNHHQQQQQQQQHAARMADLADRIEQSALSYSNGVLFHQGVGPRFY